MVKHTKTIRRQRLTNCLSVFDHSIGLVLKGLKGKDLDQQHEIDIETSQGRVASLYVSKPR